MLPTALRGAFQSCGQNCAGAERFIVHERVFDEFVRWVLHCAVTAPLQAVVQIIGASVSCSWGDELLGPLCWA